MGPTFQKFRASFPKCSKLKNPLIRDRGVSGYEKTCQASSSKGSQVIFCGLLELHQS